MQIATHDLQTKELICQVFIDSIHHYFEEVTGEESKVALPYIVDNDEDLLDDVAAMIGISGSRKGFVYFTGPDALFKELLEFILHDTNPTDEDVADMAADIANTVSGNVRRSFGADFMISVPAILSGNSKHIKLPGLEPIYTIPIKWRQHKSHVVIGLK